MKSILSRRASLLAIENQYFILKYPDVKWEVSRALIGVAAEFSEPRELNAVIRKYGEDMKVVSALKRLKESGLIVEAAQDRAAVLDTMTRRGQRKYFSIYTDLSEVSLEEWKIYFQLLEHIIIRFQEEYHLCLDNFNVCLFADGKRYSDFCGDAIPGWAHCFVSEDCLIQRVTDQPRRNSYRHFFDDYSIRAMTHELGHIATFKYCRHVPNWLAEGICEHMAYTLFPNQMYDLRGDDTSYSLSHFMDNPWEMLITYSSRKPLKNKLYCEAGEFVSRLLGGENLLSLFKALNGYRVTARIDQYLVSQGFCINRCYDEKNAEKRVGNAQTF